MDLWRNTRRSSAAVKAIAARHLEALEGKLAELESMRRTLADLIERCRGDDRPNCPILDDLEDDARRPLTRPHGQSRVFIA